MNDTIFQSACFRTTLQTFLSHYKEDLNLEEEQLQDIQFSRGSIVVTVLLRPTATGANLTILSSQLKQDVSLAILFLSLVVFTSMNTVYEWLFGNKLQWYGIGAHWRIQHIFH